MLLKFFITSALFGRQGSSALQEREQTTIQLRIFEWKPYKKVAVTLAEAARSNNAQKKMDI